MIRFYFFPCQTSRRRQAGFTFLEVMTATVILAVGIMGIYRVFLSCLSFDQRAANRLAALQVLDRQTVSARQEALTPRGAVPEASEAVIVDVEGRPLLMTVTTRRETVAGLPHLSRIRVTIGWPESGGRVGSVERTVLIARF